METITGTYDNLWMTPYPLTVIHEFEIKRGQNQHDFAMVKGMISEDTLEKYKYMLQSGEIIALHFRSKEGEQLLFSGFLEEIKAYEVGVQQEAVMKLSGLTRTLDYEKKLIDYQSENKTIHQLIEERMKSCLSIRYDISCKNKEISDFLLQYEETDYDFLKRLLSYAGEGIHTRMEGQEGRLHMGNPKEQPAVQITGADYEVFYDKYLCYRIKSPFFLDIGTTVEAYGKKLWVKEGKYSLKDGISENIYLLCEAKGFEVKAMANPALTGISLDGTIKECKRDKVKIELKGVPASGKTRWFGYSSAAASSDGSGWYCMPETGEEIRLYCPTDEEKEAYVISAIRSNSGNNPNSGESSKKPENKSLANSQGQEIHFTEEGVTLNCADGVTNVNLKSSGEIEIYALNDITILGKENVSIRAEEGVILTASDKILLENDKGSTYTIEKNISLNAKRIKNNC